MSNKNNNRQVKFNELSTLNKINRIPEGKKTQMASVFEESLRNKINTDKNK